MTFLKREVRRGNKYDGLIFDPPAFGRGGSGKIWKLERDLYILVEELVPQLISDDPALILLSCHDPDWPAERLAELLSSAVSGRFKPFARTRDSGRGTIKKIGSIRATQASVRPTSAGASTKKLTFPDLPPAPPLSAPVSAGDDDSSILSVEVAGGVLEYGPLGLCSSRGGHSLPLGVFARWSPVFETNAQ